MGRRKSGLPVHGWLIVDKPVGLTSAAVVNKVRWALNARKAGHAGTLDPAATGVLAVALGEATKTVPYVTDSDKCYHFTVRWGAATNTDDAEGTIIDRSDIRPSKDQIEKILPQFTGDIAQVPPQFSAVKIDGERAYKRAREGEAIEIAARPLYVESLTLLAQPSPDEAVFEMVCGKGGYVRSIARDMGETLGCLGHVVTLRRMWSGPFEVEDAVSFETIETSARTPALSEHLRPVEVGLEDLPELRCTPEGAVRLGNGNPGMVFASGLSYGQEAWASYEGRPVAVGQYRAGELHPSRVFNLE